MDFMSAPEGLCCTVSFHSTYIRYRCNRHSKAVNMNILRHFLACDKVVHSKWEGLCAWLQVRARSQWALSPVRTLEGHGR